jgi:hypothetical protein
MYTLLPQILNMSVTASIVIILVLAARLLLKRVPKVFSYALCAFPPCLPRIFFISNFTDRVHLSFGGTVDDGAYSSITYIPTDIVHAKFPQVDLPVSGKSGAINSSLPKGGEQLTALLSPLRTISFSP